MSSCSGLYPLLRVRKHECWMLDQEPDGLIVRVGIPAFSATRYIDDPSAIAVDAAAYL